MSSVPTNKIAFNFYNIPLVTRNEDDVKQISGLELINPFGDTP